MLLCGAPGVFADCGSAEEELYCVVISEIKDPLRFGAVKLPGETVGTEEVVN